MEPKQVANKLLPQNYTARGPYVLMKHCEDKFTN